MQGERAGCMSLARLRCEVFRATGWRCGYRVMFQVDADGL